MTAAQNARAAKAVEVTRWLRESSREMAAEGNPLGGYKAARLALIVAELFGEESKAIAAVVPALESDADDTMGTPTRRATYAGLAPDEEG